MIDGLIFVTLILIVIFAVIVFGVKDFKSWVKSKAGKGAISSMILGVLVVLVTGVLVTFATGLFSKANAESVLDTRYGYFMNNAYVFAGMDYTRKVSPQCVAGTTQDHLTSNMGMGLNVWQSPSRKVHVDLQWTHHSCVLGVDRNSYDGAGIRVTWFPWVR